MYRDEDIEKIQSNISKIIDSSHDEYKKNTIVNYFYFKNTFSL
jgi:hypothetical protein